MSGEPAPTSPFADLHGLLVALIKLALVDDPEATAPWRAEAVEAQKRVARSFATIGSTRLDNLWVLAVKAAESDPMVRRDETVNPMLPTMSPLDLRRLAASPFDLGDAVRTIRDAASFG